MLCPLCNDETDFTLDDLEAHLREVHKYNDEALVGFGETHIDLVEAQMRLEGKSV